MIYRNGNFLCRTSFDFRHYPREAGFRWNPDLKVWYTPHHGIAVRLREYFDESAKRELSPAIIEISPFAGPLTVPPEEDLLDHQSPAAKFALERRNSYLGLDPGLGKTIVAAVVAATLGEPVVYICPPFLTRNVEAEFKRWAPSLKVKRLSEYSRVDFDVLIVPDSMLIREGTFEEVYFFLKTVKGARPGVKPVVFIDEAHRFKSDEAKRTHALLGKTTRRGKQSIGLVDSFERVIYMSGTPMPNRPIELYPILSKSAPETIDFMSEFDYGKRYCAGYHNGHGWDFLGASNLPLLAKRVIAPTGPFMLRMKKSLINLPPKLEEVVVVNDEMRPRLARFDSAIGQAYANVEDLIKARIAADAGKSEDELHIATYRRLLGEQKVVPAVEFISSILDETEESILVFAFHKEVINGLKKRLKKYLPLTITGETPMKERQEIVEKFQKWDHYRLFLGNYLAAGTGFTLTKATRVIFVEYSWVPGDNEQAGDRAHRIGQKEPVLVQYLVYKDSIDKAVIETLLRKRRNIQHV